MIKKICAVYDVKASQYDRPMIFNTIGEAIRSMSDAVADINTLFAKHPEDFRLEHLGDYNTDNGELMPIKPVPIVEAAQLVKK